MTGLGNNTGFRKIVWVAMMTVVALIVGAAMSGVVRADDDPPGRVARVNYLQGTVSFEPAGGGDNDWVSAVPNRPVTTGDRLWLDQDGRAELHVGSTAFRLDRNTGISFLNLSDNAVQVQLSAGSMMVRLRRLDPTDSLEIDTPNLAFSLLRTGDYRVDVDPDHNVTVTTVFQGQGEVTGGGRSYNIIADQSARFTGADALTYDLTDADATPASEFERWASDRDRREDHQASAQYVSPELTGVEDLDANGTWRVDPGYGPVWIPSHVAADWAPYRYGHWAWVAPWGWTWVEDESWGFAPFHYGRWAMVGGGWGWIPGPLAVRPVYAPALVAWVGGGGPGFSFSVSFGGGGGGVAWFPLGPREVFVPAYRVSDAYVTRVNVTNTIVERTTVVNVYHNVNVTNVTYVNQRGGRGVTVVSHDTFVNARPVSGNVVRVPQNELERAPVNRRMDVAPVHASFVGAGRVTNSRPPAAIENRGVVARRTPPAPPARFDAGPGGGGPAVRPANGGAPGAGGGFAGRGGQPAANGPAGGVPGGEGSSPRSPGYRPGGQSQGQQGGQGDQGGYRNFNGGAAGGGNQPSVNQPNGVETRPGQPVQPNPNSPNGNDSRGSQNNGDRVDGYRRFGNGGGANSGNGNASGGEPPARVNPNAPSGGQPGGGGVPGNQGGGNRPGGGRPFDGAPPQQNQPKTNAPAPPAAVAAPPVVNQPRGNQGGGGQPGGGFRPGGNAQVNPTGNPNVRTAPAPRQPTPEERQGDSGKQQQWQQQHQQVHGNDRPAAAPPGGKPGTSPDDKKKDGRDRR